MEKRQEVLAPFSSDECPNSGEDSEEDVITDYLGSSHSDCDRVLPIINGDLRGLSLHGGIITETGYNTKDNTDKAAINMSEGGDEQQHHHQQQQRQQQQQHPFLALGTNIQAQPNPHVPLISVTPHSPGVAKNYPVLEENLQQLHEIHDCIQRMRNIALQSTLGYHICASNNAPQRLTSSCPSLCPLMASAELASRSGNHHHHDTGSDPDLVLGNYSANSSPTHFPLMGGGHARSQQMQGIDRRRSWNGDLEDLEESRRGRRRYSGQNHLQPQNMRQRSISLSSLDSENEIELDGKSCTGPVGVSNRACRSQTSTHSLNEADLIQNEYQKIVTKRDSQRLVESSSLMPGLTGSRLPLQKSISTPSIVAPQVHALTETGTRATPLLAARHERNEKGSGSETETEDLHTPHSHGFHEDREGTPNVQIDELLTDGTAYDDHHSEKTRRKRGSIFFRKRNKDKSGKKTSQQHLWVTTMVGTQGSLLCDVCMKHSTNKPLLHCDNCGASVHQSQGCKDQLVLECIKSKHHSGKFASKSSSNVSIISSNSNINKRGSTTSLPLPALPGSGREINSHKKTVSSYSPWRRVATKLGVNQTINEEKDAETGQHRDLHSGWEDFDFGDDAHQFTVADLEEIDPELTLGKEEPDSWSSAIGRNIALRLVDHCEREVKRQEHIYEFVLTEKHHCLVLLAMEKIFAEGLRRHFRLGQPDLERMFPRLRDLIDIHLRFLQKLRKRQNANSVVSTIADILVDQFSSDNAQRMKSAYGEFCSRHRDAVEAYKYYLRTDSRFARFVRHCQTNPLLKKKGIPECILFVTQRLTKYPLLIEPLIKTGVTQDEGEDLRKALVLVKEILADVDACVADKEREDRKLEIYNKIDAKSFAMYRGAKFKKSDIINRILKFEGTAYLMQGRGKMTAIVVVVLSDILFFLAERDQKYAFFVPDNKAGIVSLQKLLVREKARQESSIYLISSNPAEPEMFELKIQKPKDKQLWIQAIRSAVEACPQDSENETDTLTENNELRDTRSSSISLVSAEEKQRIAKIKESHILRIVGELRKKDAEQALLFEEKINLQMRLLQAANIWSGNENDNEKIEKHEKEGADYTRLVHNEGIDTTHLWQEVVVAVQEATRLASSLSFSAGGAPLSRSLSSAGERHSEAYIPPALCVPRRAETFAGFDKERYPLRDTNTLNPVIPIPKVGELPKENPDEKDGQELDTNKDQQWAAIRLSHHVYTLLCIISNQMTTIDSLQAQLAACKEGSMGKSNSRPNPNRQLEELRNLQDQLCREKAAFRIASQQEKTQLEEERVELARQREQLAAEQRDVTQQRDQLYRRLEALERQGVTLVGSSTTGSTMIHLPHLTQNAETIQQSARSKAQPEAKRIPLNLISATNQQKVQSNLPVKQQLPLKLASGSNNNTRSGSTASNNSPDRHSRAGSSPAIVTGSAYSSPELGNSHGIGGGNHTHLSNRSLRVTRSPPDTPYVQVQQQQQQQQQQQRNTEPQSQQQQQQQQQQPPEEEVIFF
ncbi:PREDICTED: rho guanine nucleotide exchange factor 18-like isoform X3 [Wasmannia auropunctata]|uniref:rho guanine nucleotide exchange factor 18-like isoform X3 n=1 Tax=Wasmannia auropunctata TaxID=64793 RepID=UPI0005EFA3BB|nr:PREDICTED: rho guanine nucleotide exchange factor 18-like isoform X3 [Wasmannia auropunctata]